MLIVLGPSRSYLSRLQGQKPEVRDQKSAFAGDAPRTKMHPSATGPRVEREVYVGRECPARERSCRVVLDLSGESELYVSILNPKRRGRGASVEGQTSYASYQVTWQPNRAWHCRDSLPLSR
jgi:hypothetical protein